MRSLTVSLMLLLMQLAAAGMSMITSSAAAVAIALPGCDSKCGGVDVPYPFGTRDGCHRPGFEVTCDQTHQPPKLFLGSGAGAGGPEVLELSLRNSTVRVRSAVWSFAAGAAGTTTAAATIDMLPGNITHYVLSAARSSVALVGCGFNATAARRRRRGGRNAAAAFGSCAPSCPGAKKRKLRHGPCDGAGCCEVPIPAGMATTSFDLKFSWLEKNATDRPAWVVPGASVFLVEMEWLHDRDNVVPVKLSLLNSGNATGFVIPAVLDWTLNKSSCPAAARMAEDFGCVSKNSECINSTSSAYGYVCRCSDGYNGNPYVLDGCQGSRRMHIAAGVFFAMGVGIGMFVLLMVLAAIFATKRLKVHKARKMREKFFKRNRGLLLRQLVDKDIAERMIFSLEELEKATNKFDEARILGGGGHGTVYKGILLNQRVVAIKMSRLVVQREIDEFINEVAILSQINHRNVVKLFGCCLETEVPLLVYEFIPNGTLYAHLHVDNPQIPLTWKDRLRIALEVASSLAYLHAAASTSVVHRDIKTSNILLDDRLTAKVSDFGASRGIAIDESGVTTGIQGTFGYMDPEYYYTRRLTEKSDVYSYGVMLVELLTRKKPVVYISPEGVGLVAHFVTLLSQGKLNEILDEQVIEEGEEEGTQVAEIAAMCLRMKGEDRPTMRSVEMRLQGLQGLDINFSAVEEDQVNEMSCQIFRGGNANADDNSRHYSIEEEILFSASLER